MSKIAFLFPGQGSQEIGMGQQLCADLPAAQAIFDRASHVLGYDLADVCFNGPAERLNATVVSQPALFVTSMAALEKLRVENPAVVENCGATAGLSLGEYTAMTFAGALKFEDGLRLVQRRGEAMQAASDAIPSGMVSLLGLDRESVEAVCNDARQDGEILQVANLLCPGNIAVSGHKSSCEAAMQVGSEAGAMKCIPLAVAGAFHTPIMQPAVERLAEALSAVEITESRIPVYSNVDARPHRTPAEFRERLVKQVCSPVRWHDSMQAMLDGGFDEYYEVGAGRVLRGLMKRISRKTKCHGVIS